MEQSPPKGVVVRVGWLHRGRSHVGQIRRLLPVCDVLTSTLSVQPFRGIKPNISYECLCQQSTHLVLRLCVAGSGKRGAGAGPSLFGAWALECGPLDSGCPEPQSYRASQVLPTQSPRHGAVVPVSAGGHSRQYPLGDRQAVDHLHRVVCAFVHEGLGVVHEGLGSVDRLPTCASLGRFQLRLGQREWAQDRRGCQGDTLRSSSPAFA